MALTPRLDLRQSQSLVMTPQLQQAIKLLALSNIEIEAFVASELERNPLLEVARGEAGDTGGESGGEGSGSAEPRSADAPRAQDENAPSDQLMTQGSAMADQPLDVDYAGETFDRDGPSSGDGEGTTAAPSSAGPGGDDYAPLSGNSGEAPDFDSFAGADISLCEHLMEQARATLDGPDLLIAVHLIGQIDEAGYLEADLAQASILLGVSRDEVERVLAEIQRFDPVGVGARTLAECLALQAKEADRYDPCMERLIANLDLLAKGALPQLRRICGVDEEDMADMIRELRGYDPKPGLRFARELAQPVIPDLFVRPEGDGWAVEINSGTLPRVLVNRRYYDELSGDLQDKAGRAWLSECAAGANWLVKALDQRQRTIIRVASEIVRQQEAFFRHGVSHLRPLTLRAVAETIGMHESTVSRVTSNKYLSCARGVFELKYFFTSAISSADGGEAVSAQAVKSRIKALIGAEEAKAILSDDTLVDMLRAEGFDIARRTVAKYREAMGIGSSVQRRRQKALAS